MAKDRDRALNPAAAARKAEKAKALKKSKAQVTAQRNEKLARRNPERLQRQIDELKALEARGEVLRPRDKQTLQELEKDVRAIRRAREALGDNAPQFPQRRERREGDGQRGGGNEGCVLGKRTRDGHRVQRRRSSSVSSSDTDPDARGIPMPRDTPPPIPRRRRNRDHGQVPQHEGLHALPPKPDSAPEAPKTVYSAAPQIRDLRKEATSKFVPVAVARRAGGQAKVTGGGGTTKQETDVAEKNVDDRATSEAAHKTMSVQAEEGPNASVDDELKRFQSEVKNVEMEEVSDEDR
ncbi:WW domain binding protein 11-domain-containing protein [Lineolata rhizophorae]|uniref:WW domain binding protein 11-domain-containing protein n=1 Tax=Lineolata rhizophorae TaxID=578093 RepID=A0A6A6NQ42_9PEZI|nr:WW domain binding protein 11-domain-containing protein [Lineolata rhizophorae]